MTATHFIPKNVLGIGAHSDDLDYWALAAMAEYAGAGAQLHRHILADGSRGTADTTVDPAKLVARRQDEEARASKIAGIHSTSFGGFTDGELADTLAVRESIVRAIRTTRADVVICWDPTYWYCANFGINHPDHLASGAAALAAVYPLARDHLSFPEHLEQGLQPHRVRTVLMINPDKPNHTVDATPYQATKVKALRAHGSQAGLVDYDEYRRGVLGTIETFVKLDLPF